MEAPTAPLAPNLMSRLARTTAHTGWLASSGPLALSLVGLLFGHRLFWTLAGAQFRNVGTPELARVLALLGPTKTWKFEDAKLI